MKSTFRLPLSLGLLVALSFGPLGCVRPKPDPTPQPSRISLAPTATQATAIETPSPTGEPSAEQTPSVPAEGDATPTPIEVEVITEPTAAPTDSASEGTGETSTQDPTGAPAAASEISYEVRWGDTLSAIARRFGTTVAAIQARNPRIANTNWINAGWVLVIPTGQGASGAPVAGETGDYVIQYGDTLATIARRFGVTISALAQANPWITNRNSIPTGRHLVIPAGGDWTPSGRTHTVRYGDTLASIARSYGVSGWSIVVRNNLANPNLIYPGQVLIIP